MRRVASLDVGTNTVLLLVADLGPDGELRVVEEREDVPRLGKGVDGLKRLARERMDTTANAIAAFADRARELGARDIVAAATSAARDAANRADFQALVRARADLELEILTGEQEAELCFRAVHHAFGRGASSAPAPGPLVAVDIGGGSTELMLGEAGRLLHRRSVDLGSVRLTERFATRHPVPPEDWERARAFAQRALEGLPRAPAGATVVGVAATVLSLLAIQRAQLSSKDAQAPSATLELGALHGQTLRRSDAWETTEQLARMSLEARRQVPGLDPRRSDVLPMGGLVLDACLEALGVDACRVTDRGLRYGLLLERYGLPPRPGPTAVL